MHAERLELSTDLQNKGISNISIENNTILVEYNKIPIRTSIYSDYDKTIKSFEKNSKNVIQDKTLRQQIILVFAKYWAKMLEKDTETSDDNTTNESIKIKKQDISFKEWQNELSLKYKDVRKNIQENFPEISSALEFSLSIKNILHIQNCTLPFAGIILGRPSSSKTLSLELLRNWRNTYYSDNFSAKSFVSHNTSVPKEQLKDIDLIPKIKNKIFLTPELSPTFSKKDEDILEILGILTRVLDGKGYESDSGAHGHRGYSGEHMFTMLGAAVDIPRKVHRQLSSLGPKLYFFRTSNKNRTEQEYIKMLKNDNFKDRFETIRKLLFDYLVFFESCPNMETKENIPKIEWNSEKDDEDVLKNIIKLGNLLASLRCSLTTWDTQGTQGTDYAYDVPKIEDPSRAITQLTNLAKGHALIYGRNYISKEDISIVIKVVLSTASIERVLLFDLLLAHNGKLNAKLIVESLGISPPTALRTMTELRVLGLVDAKRIEYSNEFEITLKENFSWFLSSDFKKLRNGFEFEDSADKVAYNTTPIPDTDFKNDNVPMTRTESDVNDGQNVCTLCKIGFNENAELMVHLHEVHSLELQSLDKQSQGIQEKIDSVIKEDETNSNESVNFERPRIIENQNMKKVLGGG